MFSGFQDLWLSLKLYRSRRFTRQIIHNPVHTPNLINNAVHYFIQHLIRNLRRLGCHKVNRCHGTKCHCIVVGSLVTHDTDRTHIGQCRKILVRHPRRVLAMLVLVLLRCTVNLFAVNGICILYDFYLVRRNITDNTDSKTRSREWLTED